MKQSEKDALRIAQEKIILENKSFLSSTDYEAIKWSEGYAINETLKKQRQDARDAINSAQEEITELDEIEVENDTMGMEVQNEAAD